MSRAHGAGGENREQMVGGDSVRTLCNYYSLALNLHFRITRAWQNLSVSQEKKKKGQKKNHVSMEINRNNVFSNKYITENWILDLKVIQKMCGKNLDQI